MSRFPIYVFALFFLIITSCAPFIIKETEVSLKKLEKKHYYMKKNVKIEDHQLKKGEKVNIRIKDGSDFIKIYAFSAKEDPLKAKWILVLYIFEDEFKKKKFNYDLFMKKFDEVLFENIQK